MIGRRLNDAYLVGELIGSGGFADVHVGRDLRSNTVVAIKILHSHFTRDPAILQRFLQEARTASALTEPHIVHVLDVGQDTGTYFMVMEYVRGRTLAQILQSQGPLPIPEAISYVKQVLDALAAAHQAGVVHRDIKPQNVMILADGQAKLMDFGIARDLAGSGLTQSGTYLGTPQYMSPEQARGEHVDARSDLYSTAILLFELLAGRPPFDGDNPWQVMRQQTDDAPPPLTSFRPDAPPALEQIVTRALTKKAERRYQSAAQMRQDLDRLQLPRTPAPEPPRRPTPVPPPRPRQGTPAPAPRQPTPRPPSIQAARIQTPVLAVSVIVVALFFGLLALPSLQPRVPSAVPIPADSQPSTRAAAAGGAPRATVVILAAALPPRSAPAAGSVLAGPTATLASSSNVPSTATVTIASSQSSVLTVPTSTLAPGAPTSTVAPLLPTLAPTSPTPQPTAAPPTAAPPPTTAPSPTPPPPPPPAPAVPVLVSAANNTGGSIDLAWSYPGQLGPDEWFDVRIWQNGQPANGIANVKATTYAIGSNFPGGDYAWTIAVIRKQNGVITTETVANSVGHFTWAPAASSGGGAGTVR